MRNLRHLHSAPAPKLAAAGAIGKTTRDDFYRAADLESMGDALDAKVSDPYRVSAWVSRAIKFVSGPICSARLKFSTYDQEGSAVAFQNPDLMRWWARPAKAPATAEMLSRPQRNMPFGDAMEASLGWLQLKGEFFWILDESFFLGPKEIRRKAPFKIVRPSSMMEFREGGNGPLLGWRHVDSSGKAHLLLPEQVIHRALWNPYDDLRGLGAWEAARIAAEADIASGTFARNLAANNGDRGVYVIAKSGIVSDEQRKQIEAQLRAKRQLARKGEYKTAFLTGDITVEDPKVQAVDAQFVAQRATNKHEIATAFGVPPSFFEVTASYSIGSASDRIKLIEETCMPLAAKVADAIEEVCSLLQPGLDLVAAFDFDGHSTMMQVREERLKSATGLFDRGLSWETINQHLNLGLDQFDGWDKRYLPFSLQEVTSESDDTSETQPPAKEDDLETAKIQLRALLAPRAAVRSTPRDGPSLFLDGTCCPACKSAETNPAWERAYAPRAPYVKLISGKFSKVLIKARAETLRRLAAYEQSTAAGKSVVGKAGENGLTFDLDTFLGDLLSALKPVEQQMFLDAWGKLFPEVGQDTPANSPAAEVMLFMSQRENRLKDVAQNVWDEIRDTIGDGLNDGESIATIADKVRGKFNFIDKARGQTIAITETTCAFERARQVAMKQAGIEFHQWLTSEDDRVRLSHAYLNGKVVELGEPFELPGGITLMHPGDPMGPPQEVINCRCLTIPVNPPAAGDHNNDPSIPF